MDIVIFGISGNLAEKKLIPAFTNLFLKKELPEDTHLIGFSRKEKSFDLPFSYVHVAGSYTDPQAFLELKKQLRPDKKQLFYIALPPSVTKDVLSSIHTAEMQPLILVEKPFGIGYEDARSLSEYINTHFPKNTCLKVDHYAGKKELRDMKAQDFSAISEVVFQMQEMATVADRSGYYDTAGALRDVGQNHLLFALATFFKGDKKREDILARITIDPDLSKYYFASYEGYGVMETLFSIPLILDIPSFRDIKITLRSGKALSQNRAGIIVKNKEGIEEEIVFVPGTDAYEHIFTDAIAERFVSFISDEEVVSAWNFIEKVEEIKKNLPMNTYKIGSDLREIM